MKLATTLRLGRSEECEVRLEDDTVSRAHASLRLGAGARLQLTDLQSSNGTFVHRDGRWMAVQETEVFAQDRLKLGELEVTISELLAPFPAFAVLFDGPFPDGAELELAQDNTPPAFDRPRRNPQTGDIEDLD